ncbi:hypothetical protein BH10PSE12_BH10PSE12_15830 [soil metagenome]
MTKLPTSLLSAMAVPLLALAVSGCVSFGSKPPAQVLSLSPTLRVAPGTVQKGGTGASITVTEPEAPKKLDTVRVPVQVNPTSVAYIKGVQWIDTPRHLFRSLLSETISASGTTIVLDPGQYSADPGRRLLGELVDFGIDAQSHMAIVTFDAMLASPDGSSVSKKRFSASVPVGAVTADTIGAPLNAAANKVAADVAAWITTG